MNELQNIPWGVVAPLIIINLILVVLALVDLARAERTNGPKWMWVPIILFVSLIGPISYFVVGRRQF
jgi:TctA family transporter